MFTRSRTLIVCYASPNLRRGKPCQSKTVQRSPCGRNGGQDASTLGAALAIGISASSTVPRPAEAVVLEGVGVSLLMDQFFGSLDTPFGRPKKQVTSCSGAQRSKSAMHSTPKRTNSDLIDRAFDELDQSGEKLFRDVNAVLEKGYCRWGSPSIAPKISIATSARRYRLQSLRVVILGDELFAEGDHTGW